MTTIGELVLEHLGDATGTSPNGGGYTPTIWTFKSYFQVDNDEFESTDGYEDPKEGRRVVRFIQDVDFLSFFCHWLINFLGLDTN